jgi:hypothetical protein
VKVVWGIFAWNELLLKRFGMGESEKCSLCNDGIETPWHVIGECPGKKAVEIQADCGRIVLKTRAQKETTDSKATA